MRRIRNRLMVAVNLLAIGLVSAGLFNFFSPRQYESSASLFASPAVRQVRASDVYQGTMMVGARMPTYVELATSQVVLNGVIEELQLEDTPGTLRQRVTATNPAGTTVLVLTASDPDPGQAQRVAASLAGQFSRSVQALETGTDATAQVRFEAVQPAQAPIGPSSPDQLANLAYGALIGGVLGLLVLLWPLARIASSPTGQLRVVLLGPMADRLDVNSQLIIGDLAPGEDRARRSLPATTSGDDQ